MRNDSSASAPSNLPDPAEVTALLARIRTFAAGRGIAVARASDLVLKGGAEVDRIEAGGDIGARKIQRANARLDRLEAEAASNAAACVNDSGGDASTGRRKRTGIARSAP